MKIIQDSTHPLKKQTSILCAFVTEKTNQVFGLEEINPKIKSVITESFKETEGNLGKISIINTYDLIPAKRILLVGIGTKEKISNDTFRFASGKIAQRVKDMKVKDFGIIVPQKLQVKQTSIVSQIIEGVKLSLFSFDKYKKEKTDFSSDLTILAPNSKDITKVIKRAQIISEGVIFTKEIANLPPNVCTPITLANFAKDLANKNKMKCRIFDKSQLKRGGFGGITAVGQGSKNEPRLIILEHNKGGKQKPIVIVGKAVTFDTGGISLKPGEKMDEMKFDKCGGCTVLGIMKAVSELQLPINVVGIVPSVENMPSGESYRPGDIIKLYSGKTAEILNTDAEGRLILADALSYGEKIYKPKIIIDFATLTGACIVALGTNVAGMVSNNENLVNEIKSASKETFEEVWQLPLNEDYMNMIKSDVADMKNVGIGRAAGTITAAAFLQNAVEKTPWVHFDIAGVAWTQTGTKEKPYNPKGATGFGVRLILEYLSKDTQ